MSRTLLRNVYAHYAGLVILGVSNLVLVPVLLHYLGTEGYGIYAICLTITSLLQFLELGISGAGVKYVAEWNAGKRTEFLRAFYSTGLVLFLLIGVLAAAGVLAVSGLVPAWFGVSAKSAAATVLVVRITAVGLIFFFPCILMRAYLEGFQRYDLSNAALIVQQILITILTLLLVWRGYGLFHVVLVVAASQAAECLVLLFFTTFRLPGTRFDFRSIRPGVIREIRDLSLWNLLWNFASKISWDLDTFVISTFLSARSVTPFVVGRKLPNLLSIVGFRWVQVLLPVSSELDATGESGRLRELFLRGTSLCLAFVIPGWLWLTLMSRPTMELWLGFVEEETIRVHRWMALAIFLDLSHSVSAILLSGTGRLKRISLYFLADAALNLLLSLAWVRLYGPAGVAAATAVSTAFSALFLHLPYACRTFGVARRDFFREVVLHHVLPGTVCASIYLLLQNWVNAAQPAWWFAISVAGAVAYGAVFWRVSLNPEARKAYRMLGRL